MGLRKNEVGEKKETDISVEWEPEMRVSAEWGKEEFSGPILRDEVKVELKEEQGEEIPRDNEPSPGFGKGEY